MSQPLEQPQDRFEVVERFSLTVTASDSQSEILLLDSRGRLVDRALGPTHVFSVEKGIYQIKLLTGTATQIKRVVADKDKSVPFDPLSFSSPVPLAGTSTSHEYHEAAADRESRVTHVADGQGSSLFFLVRDWTSGGTDTSRGITGNLAEGLSLYAVGPSGERKICELAAAGASDQGGDPWSACTIEVAPGIYELRLELPTGELLRQAFVASPGWQTQSFLFVRQCGTSRQWRADLSRTSVLLSRNKGFAPNESMLRIAELARQRLAAKTPDKEGEAERPLLPQEMRSLLGDKFDNPMLGIYGAHLLLLEKSFDSALLSTVLFNLRNLLGYHPDVEALALRSDLQPRPGPFDHPPMLSRSWALIVEASLEQPTIVSPALAQWSSGDFLSGGAWHIGLTRSIADTDDLELSDLEVALAEELGVMKRVRQIEYATKESSKALKPARTTKSRAKTADRSAAKRAPRVNYESAREKNIAQETIKVEIDRDQLHSMTSRFRLPVAELKQKISSLESKMVRNPAVPNLSVSIK